MPRVHTVKKARKARPEHDIAVGDSYYWWEFRFGGMRYSKTFPHRGQLTQSGFLQELYGIEDDIGALSAEDHADLESQVEDLASRVGELRDQAQESLDNMPEALQDTSQAGELLTERIEGCESWQSEMESIDFDEDNELDDIIQEIQGLDPGLG